MGDSLRPRPITESTRSRLSFGTGTNHEADPTPTEDQRYACGYCGSSFLVDGRCPVCGHDLTAESTPVSRPEQNEAVRELADAAEAITQYVRVGSGPLGDDPAAVAMRRLFDALPKARAALATPPPATPAAPSPGIEAVAVLQSVAAHLSGKSPTKVEDAIRTIEEELDRQFASQPTGGWDDNGAPVVYQPATPAALDVEQLTEACRLAFEEDGVDLADGYGWLARRILARLYHPQRLAMTDPTPDVDEEAGIGKPRHSGPPYNDEGIPM